MLTGVTKAPRTEATNANASCVGIMRGIRMSETIRLAAAIAFPVIISAVTAFGCLSSAERKSVHAIIPKTEHTHAMKKKM